MKMVGEPTQHFELAQNMVKILHLLFNKNLQKNADSFKASNIHFCAANYQFILETLFSSKILDSLRFWR